MAIVVLATKKTSKRNTILCLNMSAKILIVVLLFGFCSVYVKFQYSELYVSLSQYSNSSSPVRPGRCRPKPACQSECLPATPKPPWASPPLEEGPLAVTSPPITDILGPFEGGGITERISRGQAADGGSERERRGRKEEKEE